MRIEDYALIGNTHTAALVGRNGSIDWLCLPRFDSGACLAALLGNENHGCWRIAPAEEPQHVTRRYRPDTLVLETEFATGSGAVRLTDAMPVGNEATNVVRIVEGVRGRVPMRMLLVLRPDYGSVLPWVRSIDHRWEAIAGPDAFSLWADAEMQGKDLTTVAEFEVAEGQTVAFELRWWHSHLPAGARVDPRRAIAETADWWSNWARGNSYEGEWPDAVGRSLLTLKAMTYAPTGGIVAAPTSSLPEKIGGVRNWDYRYCWLRDASFSLNALVAAGYHDEAAAWRDWLLRAVAGDPSKLQIMYGLRGERRLQEYEVPWLPGYENSEPVRIGNAAHAQFQLDVYGEVTSAIHRARLAGLHPEEHTWQIQRAILDYLGDAWHKPDDGIWEMRGEPRHFTHSKVMAWVAFDRAVEGATKFGLDGPIDRWRAERDRIHTEVCARGFSRQKHSFAQEYGTDRIDASLLMLPLVGFLPADDARIQGTIRAVERELLVDGFVLRYRTEQASDAEQLPPGEACFLLCTFWLASVYALSGRHADARGVFERVLSVRNDVGLLAEEYRTDSRRLLGNFPQAISHVGLINAALALRRFSSQEA
jgi:GH15 family glucan-1,4-alpha-glucosidase